MAESTCSSASLEFVPRCLMMRTVLSNRPAFYNAYNEASPIAINYLHRNLYCLVIMSLIAMHNFSRRRGPGAVLSQAAAIARCYVVYFSMEFFSGYYENGCITQHKSFREDHDLSPASRLIIFSAGLSAVSSILVVVADLLIIQFNKGVRDRNIATAPIELPANPDAAAYPAIDVPVNSYTGDIPAEIVIPQALPPKRPCRKIPHWRLSIILPLAAATVLLWLWIQVWSDVTDGWCEAWEGVMGDDVLIVKGSEGEQVTRAKDLPPGAVQAAIAAGQIAVYYLPAEVSQSREILTSEMKRGLEGLQTVYIHYWALHF